MVYPIIYPIKNQYIIFKQNNILFLKMTEFKDRLMWDAEHGQILDADRRYLMLRADVLMGLFRRLEEPARGQALRALGEAVMEQGGQSARAYWEACGRRPQALLASIVNISAQLGWGAWRIEHLHDAGLRVQVRNSPFAKGFGAHDEPLCRPIVGMLTAVGALIYDREVRVQERHCCAQGSHADCLFTVTPRANE